jgi:hypothetical protein
MGYLFCRCSYDRYRILDRQNGGFDNTISLKPKLFIK